MAVLVGANTRTYKFALGSALLYAAAEDRSEILLRDLAVPYAMELVRHLGQAPQMRQRAERGESDFLSVAEREAAESLRLGSPTEELLVAAIKSMPEMVMQKFHNLPSGGAKVPHRFYEVTGRSPEQVVRLSRELRDIAQSEQAPTLRGELSARWSIVETSFAIGIGQSLIHEGVVADLTTLQITDKQRRRSVTGVTDAVIGFQRGLCLICADPIALGIDSIAVDHVFPFSFRRLLPSGGKGMAPDLDAIWNLAPTHAGCNGQKSNRLPTEQEMFRLAQRNEAIMQSPYPLKKTLALTLEHSGYKNPQPGAWFTFIRHVRGLF
ncbi:HNH endonuclease domain-containing protein [Streptosporangium amethystogenes]|uniref:HNH endonuclease domain-containing protein n=1 Tax=Streptosporangium amethystogenes TaxID=2002 RepID=UPI001B8007FB|nr:HNH endonuclease domain-containing protein [Streptosporangium amethystogenes]